MILKLQEIQKNQGETIRFIVEEENHGILKEKIHALEEKLERQEKRIRLLESQIHDVRKEEQDSGIPVNDKNRQSSPPCNASETTSTRIRDVTSRTSMLQKRIPVALLSYTDAVNPAFYAYMSAAETAPSNHHILVFDVAQTDNGNHYNKFSGIYTVPQQGTYVFAYTVFCSTGAYLNVQAVLNSDVIDANHCNAQGADHGRSTTGVAVIRANQGDVVFLRTHPEGQLIGNVESSAIWSRSTFSGWKLD
ncbi:uncharacterized protein LOC133203873 [Saccostrea echinata]|uniref:uncharacterized protein LOC133203873 n=1 Tax=Saccostrea echinata TaxID=191078 RepID=UPI002A815A69|nr:uncharacterized protein LOC133203873 [Saccostrea echinata]